jgi:hypothetical protein
MPVFTSDSGMIGPGAEGTARATFIVKGTEARRPSDAARGMRER